MYNFTEWLHICISQGSVDIPGTSYILTGINLSMTLLMLKTDDNSCSLCVARITLVTLNTNSCAGQYVALFFLHEIINANTEDLQQGADHW